MLRFSGWWRRTCGPRRVATRLGCGFLRISLLWVGLLLRISRCLRLRASRWREGLLQRVPRGTRLSRHWLIIRLRRRVLRCLCLGDTRESEKDCACRLQNVSVNGLPFTRGPAARAGVSMLLRSPCGGTVACNGLFDGDKPSRCILVSERSRVLVSEAIPRAEGTIPVGASSRACRRCRQVRQEVYPKVLRRGRTAARLRRLGRSPAARLRLLRLAPVDPADRGRHGVLRLSPLGAEWPASPRRHKAPRGSFRGNRHTVARPVFATSVESEWNDRLTPGPRVTLGTGNRTKTQSHNGAFGRGRLYSMSSPREAARARITVSARAMSAATNPGRPRSRLGSLSLAHALLDHAHDDGCEGEVRVAFCATQPRRPGPTASDF
jgi:hypothetical protein